MRILRCFQAHLFHDVKMTNTASLLRDRKTVLPLPGRRCRSASAFVTLQWEGLYTSAETPNTSFFQPATVGRSGSVTGATLHGSNE